MFNPMGPHDNTLQLLLLGLAFVGSLVGLYWIHRITKDIEDN